ncbi:MULTISPECIES: hypothetical protein [Peptoniphilus]|uniref:hypothetical protein n=1 Tax=Peptoniphilus TaxID=162289 RepID=UPI0001DA9B02|nr:MULTISPECIES: hypothetical protein [Peptoniphilus]EFI42076.1 hypothetical protein HMPREF0629_00710 [Peptoniphilus sp. oral taxon 386 str. F0131]
MIKKFIYKTASKAIKNKIKNMDNKNKRKLNPKHIARIIFLASRISQRNKNK